MPTFARATCASSATFAALALSLLASNGCSSCDGPSTPAAPALPDAGEPGDAALLHAEFQFDWAPPCRVPVVEHLQQDQKRFVVHYVIDVRADAAGALEVRHDGYKIVSANDQDVSSPGSQERIAQVTAMMSLQPTLVVSRDGIYQGTRGLEEIVERLIAGQPWPAAEAARLRAGMLDPGMRAALDEKMGDQWGNWVQSWIGWKLFAGQSAEEASTTPLPGGGEGPVTVKREYLDHRDAHAHLRATVTIEGSTFLALMAPVMRAMGPDVPADFIVGGRKLTTISAETHWLTLRPRRTRSESLIAMRFKDGTQGERHEVHELEWDWAAAQGCKK